MSQNLVILVDSNSYLMLPVSTLAKASVVIVTTPLPGLKTPYNIIKNRSGKTGWVSHEEVKELIEGADSPLVVEEMPDKKAQHLHVLTGCGLMRARSITNRCNRLTKSILELQNAEKYTFAKNNEPKPLWALWASYIGKSQELFIVYPKVLRSAGRDIIRVAIELGKWQGFYKSSGRNSGMPNTWLPFDGIREDGWFDKSAYAHDTFELHRFGTKELRIISKALGEMKLPTGIDSARRDINNFLTCI